MMTDRDFAGATGDRAAGGERALLEALPVAVYVTDREGWLTFHNTAAAELWGRRPELGKARWCGAWRLRRPDGGEMPPAEHPTAICLTQERSIRGMPAVAVRPDGTAVPFAASPTLLRDAAGEVTGAICLLIDATDRGQAAIDHERLAAIVSSSNDAIIGKTLDGIVTSWNDGARRIFGYPAEEMIGRPITTIIPPELLEEERDILARLRRGERIEHFDTVRVAKDGRRIDISLAVSPVRDGTGRVVGASKVARDVSDRKRSEELQRLLIEELNHRVKNTLATVQAIATQSLRRAASPDAFVASFGGRVRALARAHDIVVGGGLRTADVAELVREHALVGGLEDGRIRASGPKVLLGPREAVQLALVLHELATNARKHGALSVAGGTLRIGWRQAADDGPRLLIDWTESGVPGLTEPATEGFGTTLIHRSLEAAGGTARASYGPDGVAWELAMPLEEAGEGAGRAAAAPGGGPAAAPPAARGDLEGRRVLLAEDEPLVSMDLEAQLAAAGVVVVGPAATAEAARRLAGAEEIDAALLDANLGGRSVDEVARVLAERGIPFAFVSGYGRNGLPAEFRDAPLLAKPFDPNRLLETLGALLPPRAPSAAAAAPG